MGTVFDAMRKRQQEGATPAHKPAAAAAEPVAPPVSSAMAESAATAAAAPPASVERTAGIVVQDPNYSQALVAFHDRGGHITEQYRALRARLLARYGEKAFCLMLTSAEPGEGKTVTTLNLGMVLAGQQERKIVAIDCDLRRRRLGAMMHLPPGPGMAELLTGAASLEEVLRPTVHPNLSIIPAGNTGDDDAGELVTRPELGEAIATLRRQFDTVLIDAPPVNAVSDVGILGPAAGEALMVVRMNRTRRETVERAIHLLEAVNVKIIGLVLTHQRYFIPNYLYRYS